MMFPLSKFEKLFTNFVKCIFLFIFFCFLKLNTVTWINTHKVDPKNFTFTFHRNKKGKIQAYSCELWKKHYYFFFCKKLKWNKQKRKIFHSCCFYNEKTVWTRAWPGNQVVYRVIVKKGPVKFLTVRVRRNDETSE